MQCTAQTGSLSTAWDKMYAPLAHLLYPFIVISGCLLALCTTAWWPLLVLWWQGQAARATCNSSSRKICATCHLQLFKKNLCNKEVAKEPKSQIKILEPSASQKSQISGFWLQTGQSGTLGFIYCMAATTYVKMHVHD